MHAISVKVRAREWTRRLARCTRGNLRGFVARSCIALRFCLSLPAHPGRLSRTSGRAASRRGRVEAVSSTARVKRTVSTKRHHYSRISPPEVVANRLRVRNSREVTEETGREGRRTNPIILLLELDEVWRSILRYIARKPMIFLSHAYQVVYDYRNRWIIKISTSGFYNIMIIHED